VVEAVGEGFVPQVAIGEADAKVVSTIRQAVAEDHHVAGREWRSEQEREDNAEVQVSVRGVY
jgi:hypothetical protein